MRKTNVKRVIEWLSNSNWTKWSTIQGVIVRVISKSVEGEAQGRFEIMSMITPWIVRHKVQLLINRVSIKNCGIKIVKIETWANWNNSS